VVLVKSTVAGAVPEYSAAEAPRHIGEKATVVGKVGCIQAGRKYHMLALDGCTPNSPFWIIVNDNASGPELNVQDFKGNARLLEETQITRVELQSIFKVLAGVLPTTLTTINGGE
jgi:hypothetical protein